MTLWISWSQLRTHEECRQKGKLVREKKRATLADQRIYFPGTVLDRVVRDWLDDDPEHNPGVMPDMVNEIMVREFKNIVEGEGGRVEFKDKADKIKVRDDVVEAAQKIEPLLRQHVLPYEYQVDFRFRAPLMLPAPWGMEMVIVNGAMDILTRNDKGEFGVWDVKMTRNNDYWRKTAGQLTFYDAVVGILFGAETFETGLLQPLCAQPNLPLSIGPEQRSQMMQRIVSMAHDVWRGDFTPTTKLSECSTCDVKHACSRFKPVINSKGKKMLSFAS